MPTLAPPRFLEVRCPKSDHLLFRAAAPAFGTVIGTVCKCGLWVYGSDARALEVALEQPPR